MPVDVLVEVPLEVLVEVLLGVTPRKSLINLSNAELRRESALDCTDEAVVLFDA